VTARIWTTTACLIFVVTVPAAGPSVAALAERATITAAHPRAIGNGRGYIGAPQPIEVSFGRSRPIKPFVRPGERVKRGQLLGRAESPRLRRQVRAAEAALENARAELARAKRQAAARNRHAQLSATRASTLRSKQDALDAARATAKAKSGGSEQRIARAQQGLAAAQRSSRASEQRLQAAADRAQHSLERARAATATDGRQLDQRVADAKRQLAEAQASARASDEQLQAAVDAAQQTLEAAKNSQAENAQAYQSAVDEAQQGVGEAEDALARDQDKLSAAKHDREQLEDEVASRRQRVDDLHAQVKADRAAVDACQADSPPEGCSAVKDDYYRDVAKLEDEQARLAKAESNLADAESDFSSLKDTVAADQAAVGSAESALANAQQAQATGQAEDEQRGQAAQDALTSAQAAAASGASAGQATVSNAKSSLDSATSTRDSHLSRDRQSLVDAQTSRARAQMERASGADTAAQAVRSARRALVAARTAGRSTVAQTEREVGAAAATVNDAQQSLNSALAAGSSFVNAPTASDLAVAETKVELAKLAMVSARNHLADATELRAPAAGTVAASSSDSVSLTGLDSPQVKVSLSAEETAGIRPGQPALITISAAPDTKLAAHVLSVGPASPAADGTSRREVTFALDEDDPSVKPGVAARAELTPEEDETAARLQRLRERLAAEQDVARQADAGVVGIATRYLGVPYVWGGASPEMGFDCSGLVMYVFAQLGVSLPHYAASQYNYGIPVPRDQLEPGDLVFFEGLGHVGIYIGNDEFIHAPHTGDVVKISSLDDFSYASTYVGARRLETPAHVDL
jgi:cell wall-associated NlpC family hydrolase